MHVTAQGHFETLYTAISIKVVGSFQAYPTRPKGSVGSCKYSKNPHVATYIFQSLAK